tara:strand:+ start:6177 stop:7415 length:1239 start_codon:yes stop_codon:yes gene_type:complete
MFFDDFDPVGHMYLNPTISLSSVEDSYIHYSNNTGSVNMSSIPPDFDHKVYYYHNSNDIIRMFEYTQNLDDVVLRTKAHYILNSASGSKFKIDSDFNPHLYRIFHSVTEEVSDTELYFDYLERIRTEDMVVGNMDDLTLYARSNVSLRFNNLVVDKKSVHNEDVYIKKNLYMSGNVCLDEGSVFINGGSLTIQCDHNSIVSDIFNYNTIPNQNDGLELGTGGVTPSSITSKEFRTIADSNLVTNVTEWTPIDDYHFIKKLTNKKFSYDGGINYKAGVFAQDILNLNSNLHIVSSYHDQYEPLTQEQDLTLSINDRKLHGDFNSIGIDNGDVLVTENSDKQSIEFSVSNLGVEMCHVWVDIPNNLTGETDQTFKLKGIKKIVRTVDYSQLFCHLLGAFKKLDDLSIQYKNRDS